MTRISPNKQFFIGLSLAILGIGVSIYFGTRSPSSPSISIGALSSSSVIYQTMENSPNSIQAQSLTIQQRITKVVTSTYPVELTYQMVGSSSIVSDGVYGTLFEIQLYYDPKIQPPLINDVESIFAGNIGCKLQSRDSHTGLNLGDMFSGMSEDTYSIFCNSSQPIIDTGKLFVYRK